MAKKKAAPEPEKIIRLEDDAIMVQGEIRALAKMRDSIHEKHSWSPELHYGLRVARDYLDEELADLGGREVAPGYNGDPNAYRAKLFTLIQDAAFEAYRLLPMTTEEAKVLVADVAAAAVKEERERADGLEKLLKRAKQALSEIELQAEEYRIRSIAKWGAADEPKADDQEGLDP